VHGPAIACSAAQIGVALTSLMGWVGGVLAVFNPEQRLFAPLKHARAEQAYGMEAQMTEALHLSEALGRLKDVFSRTVGLELVDSDVAELAGLDDEVCRILLAVLEKTGAIERSRSHVFVCRSSNWLKASNEAAAS
jgi:hypothetical protein